jgi:phosphoglycolate phosphatase (TIGR01487 family)
MNKVLFLDIDGTITDESGLLPFSSIEKIRELRRSNFIVIACSANAYYTVRILNRYFDIFDYIIAENGGVIDNGKNLTILADKQIAIKALNAIKQNFPQIIEHWSNPIRLSDQALMKVNDSRLINNIKDFILSNPQLDVKILDTGYSLIINQRHISKASAAKLLLEKLNLKSCESYAIGDSEVDIDIFEFVDFPIALSNSHGKLKEKAKLVSNEGYYKGFIEIAKRLIEM